MRDRPRWILFGMHSKHISEDNISRIFQWLIKKQVRIQELQMQIEFQKEKYGQDSSGTNFDLMMAAQRFTSAYGGNNKARIIDKIFLSKGIKVGGFWQD